MPAVADKQEARALEERTRVQLAIEGMTWASCAARIERKLNKLEGVEAAVNYATDSAAVVYDPSRVEIADLLSAVEAAGYRAAARKRDEEGDPTRGPGGGGGVPSPSPAP